MTRIQVVKSRFRQPDVSNLLRQCHKKRKRVPGRRMWDEFSRTAWPCISPLEPVCSPKMQPLAPPDSMHLQAAEGWLELDNHLDENEELEKIEAKLRAHPDVLEVRWKIYARAKKWDVCLDLANAITKLAPERPFGWIHGSFALHELKRTHEAWDNLSAVVAQFPDVPIIPYNLACYACQLGRLSEARDYLGEAFDNGGGSEMKLMALEDPDLEPLWAKISEL